LRDGTAFSALVAPMRYDEYPSDVTEESAVVYGPAQLGPAAQIPYW